MIKTPFRFAPVIATILLAGCGGGGHHHSDDEGGPSTFSADLKLTTDPDYNGSTKDLTGTPKAELLLGSAFVVVENGGRSFNFGTKPDAIQTGATLTIGQNGVTSSYQETEGTGNRTWQASGGTVTITRFSNGTLDATVDGLTYAPSTFVGDSTAAGTFTVSGTIKNAAFSTSSE